MKKARAAPPASSASSASTTPPPSPGEPPLASRRRTCKAVTWDSVFGYNYGRQNVSFRDERRQTRFGTRAISSAVRGPALHAGCRGLKSLIAHLNIAERGICGSMTESGIACKNAVAVACTMAWPGRAVASPLITLIEVRTQSAAQTTFVASARNLKAAPVPRALLLTPDR